MVIYQHWYSDRINFGVFDIIFILILVLIVYLYAGRVKEKNKDNLATYKYLPRAIIIKIFAGIIFAAVTMAFYPGDTFEYFKSTNAINNLLLIDPGHYLDVLFKGNIKEYWYYFTTETGRPSHYMWKDPNSIFVARVYSPLLMLCSGHFVSSTLIASIVGFTGLWKLYLVFCKLYPGMEKKFAIAILYFPSVLFWSSGILKDTLTISAVGWIVYSFYNFAILRKFKIKYVIALIIASFIIINLKAYIFAALVPGLFVWFFFKQLSSIKSGLMKFIVAPFLIIVVLFGFSFIMSGVSGAMDQYGDVDTAIQHAQVIQQDLTRSEQYGENYYDVGKFEATPMGIIKKAPIAIVSGIFRPFIWEARNPFVLLSALEGMFLMGFLLFVIFKKGPVSFFKNIFKDPMLIFSLSFVIIFGFGVGLASANFGALVRYKIPMLPFFVSGLIVLWEGTKKQVKNSR